MMQEEEEEVDSDMNPPFPDQGRLSRGFESMNALGDGQFLKKTCTMVLLEDAASYFLSVGDKGNRTLNGSQQDNNNLDDIIAKALVDHPTTTIQGVSFAGHISAVMQKNPGLMAKLLEEIPCGKTLRPNLSHFFFFLPPKLHNLPKFLFLIDTYILGEIIEDQPFTLLFFASVVNFITDNRYFIFNISAAFNNNNNQSSIESSSSSSSSLSNKKPQSWKLPLLESLFRKPNLEQIRGYNLDQRTFDGIICCSSGSSSQLKDLELADMEEGMRTDDWLPLLLAALQKKDHHHQKQKNRQNKKGKKRKRSHPHHHHQMGTSMAGSLHQLGRLSLKNPTPMKRSHLLSMSDALQKNSTICHLLLDKLTLITEERPNSNVSHQDLEREMWHPFVDILRHNNTLTKIQVHYNLPDQSIDLTDGNYSPYWQEPISSVLTDHNYKISSIVFGYNRTNGIIFDPDHSDHIQYRLDLNYFGLGRYGSCAATATATTTEGFPEALVSATEKDKKRGQEGRQLIPCLFQLLSNNPSLLINHHV